MCAREGGRDLGREGDGMRDERKECFRGEWSRGGRCFGRKSQTEAAEGSPHFAVKGRREGLRQSLREVVATGECERRRVGGGPETQVASVTLLVNVMCDGRKTLHNQVCVPEFPSAN